MRHRPRPTRVAALAVASFACAALWHFRIEPQVLFLASSPLLAGASAYEAIPGERG